MEKEQTKQKEEDVLEKDRKEKTPEQANQAIPTIMPTMIDESEERIGKVRDLSSIIPTAPTHSSNENLSYENQHEDIELISKENDLKGDGSIAIANIDENGEAILRANFNLPDQIDINSRKEERERAKVKKVKKEKKKITKGGQRSQNIISLVQKGNGLRRRTSINFDENAEQQDLAFKSISEDFDAKDYRLEIRARQRDENGELTNRSDLVYDLEMTDELLRQIPEEKGRSL